MAKDDIGQKAITATSVWEKAQTIKSRPMIEHVIDIKIANVMDLTIDKFDNFVLYVNLGDRKDPEKADWYRLTNMEGFDEVSRL